MKGRALWFVAALASGILCSVGTKAADLNIRVLGLFGNQPQNDEVEAPFWKELAASSNGKIAVTYRTLNDVNLKGFDSLRVLQAGTFDIVAVQVGFVSGDDPVLVGHDLPGVAFTFPELRAVTQAYRPVVEERLKDRFKATLLTQYPYPPQILYCKDRLTAVTDLNGRKVRAGSAAVSELIKGWGGIAVTLAGTEVYQALQRGIVDCAITGSAFGNSYNWFEVANYLYVMPVGGYALVAHVANSAFWSKLSPEQRGLLTEKLGQLENKLWAIGQETHEDGIRCNAGEQPCQRGKPGKMTVVQPTDSDKAALRSALQARVMPTWIADCSRVFPKCKDEWNRTVGKLVRFQM